MTEYEMQKNESIRIAKEIINYDQPTSISAYAFELFSLSVLKDYLKSQNKGLILPSEYSTFDAYLPTGIDDSDTPTDVEIKFLRTNKSGYWRSLEQICRRLNESQNIDQLLIILGTEFSQKSKESLYSHPSRFTTKAVIVWDLHDFLDKTADYIGDNLHYLQFPQKAIIEKAILDSRSEAQEAIDRNKLTERLKQRFLNEDLVLVLGAGVSIDAQIPLWNDLIKVLLVEMVNEKLKENKGGHHFSKDDVDQLAQLAYKNREDSPLSQMRYIRSAFEPEDYKRIIHKALYANSPKSSTELLKAIVELCAPQRRHIGVKSIITYNFDDLVERRLAAKGIQYTSVFRETDSSSLDNLNIFHVHGFLPQERDGCAGSDDLIFSEEDYHRVYRDAYCWSNITQLNSFRESTCLFIGCSLNDPNLRRLLDVAARNGEEPRHFAILKKHQPIDEHGSSITNDVLNTYQSIDNSIRDSYYRTLGINVLWTRSYYEIPDILRALKT